MTAKEQVLAIYPTAIFREGYVFIFAFPGLEYSIRSLIRPDSEDACWEYAWEVIQLWMIDKLAS